MEKFLILFLFLIIAYHMGRLQQWTYYVVIKPYRMFEEMPFLWWWNIFMMEVFLEFKEDKKAQYHKVLARKHFS